mmetsp:Transcript_8781/g.28882  ORF Transcript_8781/g.28882 Transcript_8781/m.28882 type:complete len:210 (-) Transcript_8781:1377-2006(-)|eukprot:CAMPEP_0170145276 /NCGR_PEP_ID=MMETSP0033_2-20121228/16426_1 /TAXON_ID=195969 /ORGANISM="Dolichomastix tenuilepis, Strain CCMP3274" /LENGTH=209 /DNA_ID=CAMNT_0010381821 /DNA_START=103 /DNA_END=732 /DNA_ORIENTATION=-
MENGTGGGGANILRSGWMQKKGGSKSLDGRKWTPESLSMGVKGILHRHNWSRRFFVLDDTGRLRYYKSDPLGGRVPSLGDLQLQDCSLRKYEHPKSPYCFAIKLVGEERPRELIIRADSEEDRESWMKELRYVATRRRISDALREAASERQKREEQEKALRRSSSKEEEEAVRPGRASRSLSLTSAEMLTIMAREDICEEDEEEEEDDE